MKSVPRTIWLGALAWFLCGEYFITEIIVAHAWVNPIYSFRFNYISDLSETVCPYLSPGTLMTVCSPLHAFMNASFIINGILIIVGCIFLRSLFPQNKYFKIGLRLLGIGSLGLINVGIFPENSIFSIHILSALWFFTLTNIGLVLMGIELYKSHRTPLYAWYTILSGVIAVIAYFFYGFGPTAVVGTGYVERAIGDPLTIWLVVSGILIFARKGKLLGGD